MSTSLNRLERVPTMNRSNPSISPVATHLLRKAKLSALGEMAGQIAHEINTPLGAIVLIAQGLKQKAQNGVSSAEIENMMDMILQVTNKLTKIVGTVRKLASQGPSESIREIKVNELIKDTLLLCEGKFRRSGVDLKVDFRIPEQKPVHCRANELIQVLINLLNNAFDAVQGLSDRWTLIEVTESNERLKIAVKDSGPPIPEEIRAQMFMPNFTTKSLESGTGFGLPICKSIIESHGGNLYFDQEAPCTSFVFEIPFDQSDVLADEILGQNNGKNFNC